MELLRGTSRHVGVLDLMGSLQQRVPASLGLCLALVCWSLGLSALLVVNYASWLSGWLVLSCFVQMPAMVLLAVVLPTRWTLRPVTSFMQRQGGDAGQIQKLALSLPRRTALWSLGVGVVGSVLVALQNQVASLLPADECVKLVLLGIPLGLMAALLTYFILSTEMQPVVERCDKLLGTTPGGRPRISLAIKIAVCMMVAVVYVTVVMGLLVYTHAQRVAGTSVSDIVGVAVPTIGVALALALACGYGVAGPIVRLTRWMHVPSQDVPQPASDDETEELSRGIRSVFKDLQETRRQLGDANMDLLRTVRNRKREMEAQVALFEVSRAVASSLHLDQVLHEIATRAVELTGAGGCAVLLVQNGQLELTASAGLDVTLHPPQLPLNWKPALTLEGPQVLHLRTRTDTLPSPWRQALQQQQFSHALAVPMVARGSLVGIFCVYFRQTTELQDRTHLLMTLGGEAAVAIDHASLYAEQQRVTRLLRDALSPRTDLGVAGVEVGHCFHPSLELSGDYYDLMPRDRPGFDAVIADAAGKEPDAAIRTARAKHMIEAYGSAGLGPARTLQLLNRQLVPTDDSVALMTIFYAQVDVDRHTMRYACAGHEPPLMWRPSSPEPIHLGSEGLAAGVMADADYGEREVALEPGTTVLLYTDGVTEARSPDGRFFGLEGLLDVIRQHSEAPPQDLVNHLFSAVEHFSQSHLNDDLSLLAFRIG